MTLDGRVRLERSGRTAVVTADERGLTLHLRSLRDAWRLRGERGSLRRVLPLLERCALPARVRVGRLASLPLVPRGLAARIVGLG